ncbi:MAG: 8-oxo-dGTP diphosphatase [Candidatus Cloacimonetes bacterium]|nr:8-oxo-dGTP diphosphatase [Candidatus Cloacimonadota bacterium]
MKLATLCYVKQDGKTLMLFRNKKENDTHEGKWNGLGGKLEQGETPEDCVIREIREESGLEVTEMELKGFITFPMFDGKDDWFVFLYVITGFNGELIESPEGELEWIADEKLLKLNLWAGDRIFLPWLENEEIFSARFDYEKGELQDWTVSFY